MGICILCDESDELKLLFLIRDQLSISLCTGRVKFSEYHLLISMYLLQEYESFMDYVYMFTLAKIKGKSAKLILNHFLSFYS